jgi:hypothetical protein
MKPAPAAKKAKAGISRTSVSESPLSKTIGYVVFDSANRPMTLTGPRPRSLEDLTFG